MNIKKYLFFIFFVFLYIDATSQVAHEDCIGAIPVCRNVYTEASPYLYSGVGHDPNEIDNTDNGCITAENNGVWYIISVQKTGMLRFTLSPENNVDDFDWTLIDITNISCQEIFERTDLYISTNTWGNIDYNGPTGANSKYGYGNCSGPGTDNGPNFNQDIPVYKNGSYALYISNFTKSQNGYRIDFSESSAVIFDDVPPAMNLNFNKLPKCGDNFININFTEYVKCEYIAPDFFSIQGANITSVISQCNENAEAAKQFTIMLDRELTPDNYIITTKAITDNCGNFAPQLTLEINLKVQLNEPIIKLDCETNKYTINMNPAGNVSSYNYFLYDENNNFIPASENKYYNLTAGNYTGYVQNKITKCKSDEFSINLKPYPYAINVDIKTTPILCYQGKAELEIITDNTSNLLQFSIDNGITYSNQKIYQNISAGVYNITLLDDYGCKREIEEVVFTQPTDISVDSILTNPNCYGDNNGKIELSIYGGTPQYNLLWNTGEQTPILNNLHAGSYTVEITDNNLCKKMKTFYITQPEEISCLPKIENLKCYGDNNGKIELSITGGTPNYKFLWETGEQTQVLTNLATGNYTVEITDKNLCKKTETYNITQPDEIFVNSVSTNVTCNGGFNGEIILAAIGGTPPYSFNWNTGQNTATIKNLFAGEYTIILSDKNNCQKEQSFLITQPETIKLQLPKADISCYGNNDGQIIPNIIGGEKPFIYQWSNGSNTEILTNLAAGVYELTVFDASNNDCAYAKTTIIEPTELKYNYTTENATCFQQDNGKITGTPQGGTPEYIITLENQEQEIITLTDQLKKGTYIISVTDKNKCLWQDEFNITEPEDFFVEYQTVQGCPLISDGQINLTIKGATPPYLCKWSANQNLQNAEDLKPGNYNWNTLMPGSYNLSITDYNKCLYETEIQIPEYDCTPFIELYNIFTPNNDNKNDVFFLKTSYITTYEVIIYNRWGQEVYSFNQDSQIWDGKDKDGENCTTGIYFCIVHAVAITGKVFNLNRVVHLYR